jgi:MFS family permease
MADKLGHFNVMIAMSLLTTILILGVLMPTNSSGALIAFTTLFGFSSGAGIGLAPVLVAQVSPIQEIGARTGTAFSIAAFAALTGSPIGGRLISVSHGKFFNIFLFAGVSCAIGTVLFILARISKAGVKFGRV